MVRHLDSVSRMDMDMSSSCASFCLPNATAPLVTRMHSLPMFWISEICSMMAARRPRAMPCPSSLVTTADPILMTTRLAFFNWSRVRKGSGRMWGGSPLLPWRKEVMEDEVVIFADSTLKMDWERAPVELAE